MSPSQTRGHVWFRLGSEAFHRSFPAIAARVPLHRFYVCPICLRAFAEEALTDGLLTREHAPPRSVGGQRLALTCKSCNSTAGYAADSDLRREADLYDFASGKL